ncbi:type II secretion system protein N [Mycetohabitans sp. B8]|uniref:type II secretion system protein N n=1 Tax=Mycetohabitans sp. B8 TaxID=2841845 RepID=UPI001F3F9837|nr:type II secretion system protein N [Mycetohabitans sp. B8]MCG1041154.1 type II secretion system protein N [Mycetohabitans sp. B8]
MIFLWRRIARALPWIVAGGLAALITLLCIAPAAWITPQFGRATGGYVNLVDPAGSLWHGSATLLLAPGSERANSTLLPGRVEWHTAFWPLFGGRLHMTLQHTEAMPQPVTLDASRSQAVLGAGSLVLPATLLAGLGAPFNTLDLQGDVRLSWTDLRVLNQQAYGQLTVLLTDMASRVSPVRPLGSYRVTLLGQGPAATLQLATLSGPLQLDGAGQWRQGRFAFKGTARSTSEARGSLTGLLNLLGRRIDDTTYAITFAR